VSTTIAAREPGGAEREIIIQLAHGWMNLHEVWEDREPLYFLTWRGIKVRYKQMMGAAWAIVPPFFTMVASSVASSSGTCAATLPSTAEPAARVGAAP
jgi:lipopolysaccharide transport system permease protein